jgi:hypothetical protein
MTRSSLRSLAVPAAVVALLLVAGTADVLAQRSGGGGGRASGGGAAPRVSGGVPGGGGGGRVGGAVPGGPGRPVGPGGAVPRPGGPGRPNGQAVVVRGGYGYGYGYGHGYCCGYYGYPYGYYSPWYGWGGGWGFSIGFSWGYPYGAYYGGYPYAYGYPYPYPYSSASYGRYTTTPGGGYVEAAPEQSRTPIPDQIQQPSASFGMISMKVQPGDAEVLIDGEAWNSPATSRLVIQLAPGRHRVIVRKTGFDTYTEEVLIRVGATMTLNVSLLRGEK